MKSFYERVSEKIRDSDGRRKAGIIAGVLAVAVLGGTIGVLSQTGHTKTGATYCGYDDHEHTDACYAAPLVCDPAGTGKIVLHVHDQACYGPDGSLICDLPEIQAHEHTDACYQTGGGHYAHDESCYDDVKTLVCQQEEIAQHTHSLENGCYDGDGILICEQQETHSHGPACYGPDGELTCEKPEILVHVHDQDCYHIDYHVLVCGQALEETAPVQLHEHTPACYETVYGDLACELDEMEAHVHTIACYTPAVAGHVHTAACYSQVARHVHDESCYENIPGALICELEETEGHEHSDACYPLEKVLSCGQEESEDIPMAIICGLEETPDVPSELICTLEETPGHTHSDACYDVDNNLVCGMDEVEAHYHTSECWSEEIKGHTHDINTCYSQPVFGHHHDASCYSDVLGETPICGMEECEAHKHDKETCYAEDEKVLICKLETGENHEHTDACHISVRGELTCTEPESVTHRHSDSCYNMIDLLACENELVCDEVASLQNHVHDETCRVDVRGDLICELQETETHEHGDACYDENGNLICDIPEGHKHDDSCYSTVPVLLCENELTCGEAVTDGHVHDELCYEQSTNLICGKTAGEPESMPVCGREELVPHEHTAACYLDPAAMHVHDESCYVESENGMILACGQLAASDCEIGPDGLVIACGLPEVVIHQHTDACFGEIDLNGEPACGKHTHTAECYQDPSKNWFSKSETVITCPDCGEENIHTHTAGSETCGLESETPVLICDQDHEHDAKACWTNYPDCIIGDHVCGNIAGDDITDEVEPEIVNYETCEFEGDGYSVTARVPDSAFDIPVELRAERLERGSEGWNRYMDAVGADPDSDDYMLVVDIWFVDAADLTTVITPDTSKGQIYVTATASDDSGNSNSAEAVWDNGENENTPDDVIDDMPDEMYDEAGMDGGMDDVPVVMDENVEADEEITDAAA